MAKSATGVAAPPKRRIGSKMNSGIGTSLNAKPAAKARKGGKVRTFLTFARRLTGSLLAKLNTNGAKSDIGNAVAMTSYKMTSLMNFGSLKSDWMIGMPIKSVLPKDDSRNILTKVAREKRHSLPRATLKTPAKRHEVSPSKMMATSEKSMRRW